jgi:hypothetical protein
MITGSGHMLMLQVPLTLPAIVGLRRLARVGCRADRAPAPVIETCKNLLGGWFRERRQVVVAKHCAQTGGGVECGHLILEGMRQR